MPQAGTDDIPSSILAVGPPDLHSRQSQTDVLPVMTERNHGVEEIQGHVQTAEPTDAKTLAEEDDEVQFVFWAPRRKKKKRKRAESSQAHSDPRNHSPTPSNIISTPTDPERQDRTMAEPLESTRIGTDEKAVQNNYVSSSTLPTSVDSALNPQAAPFTLPLESNQVPVQSFTFPLPSTSWWNDPAPSIQAESTLHHDWKPVVYEEMPSKKRKPEENLEGVRLYPNHAPRPMQPSPQANQATAKSMPGSGFGGMYSTSLDMHGSSNMQPNFGTLNPSQSAMSSWANLGWNPYDNTSAGQAMPRYMPSTVMTMSMPVGDRTWPSRQNSSQQYFQNPATSLPNPNRTRHQRSGQSSISPKTNPTALPRSQFAQSATPATQRRSHQQLLFAQSQFVRTAPLAAPTGPKSQDLVSSIHFRSPVYERKDVRATNFPPTIQSQVQPTLPSDIQRKPSLYKIPVWPSRPVSHNPPQAPKATVRPTSSNMNENSGIGLKVTTGARANRNEHPSSASNAVPSHQDALQAAVDLAPVQTATTETSPRPHPSQHQGQPGDDPSPENLPGRKTPHKKHSPNLIVDIAETCQENFPFAAIAERHKLPIQKVFDTFSAIIQLPLLRSADDKRRHGSLGKRRMKEYKDARKAMERAQDSEMKAQLKVMKNRLDEEVTQKKPKGPSKAPGLLKAAILNNIRESQANASMG